MPQDYMKAIEDLNDRAARPDPYRRIAELEAEIATLRQNAHAATDDLAGEVLTLRAQIARMEANANAFSEAEYFSALGYPAKQ